MKDFMGKSVKVTTPDGREYKGQLAGHYDKPIIILKTQGMLGGDNLILPADSVIEELPPSKWVTCDHCHGKGRWNEGGHDYADPQGFVWNNFIGT